MNSDELVEKLHSIDREYRHLERAAAALQWDQETYLPPRGVAERAEQLAVLEGIAHERLTAGETGSLLAALGSVSENPRGYESLSALNRDFLRVMRRRFDKAVKLPVEFVSAAARAEGLSQAAWVQARRNNDFAAFLPHLQTMIDFARKKAEYWGFGSGNSGGDSDGGGSGQSLYDGLLDIYEPGMGAVEISALFAALRERLTKLLKQIASRALPDTSFLTQTFAVEQQAAFNQRLMDYIGFDRERGRLDTSAHPFTTTLGSDDIRITTRYFPANLLSGLFSVIHETGHALYEMGFPPELRGSCLADGASMALHESQSRFWENVIGRSRPFLSGIFPMLCDCFPQLAPVSADSFYRAVNAVRPSLIRVDADELSYSLHIILRFELEQQLISGELAPEKLPAIWREKTKEYFGLESETDADGVLQDIHWSMGSFGYFPSYALGNLYGLQITGKLKEDIPELDGLVAAGQFERLYTWLRDTVYCWGCRLEPAELLYKITGEKLQAGPFLNYIEGKYSELYGL
ncbi:MAG: carboxypeptidase M32 [Treponema sp.]|jgi:carboxypeptidase Taq|nr:carboxypeptidase M32 [Treponema sp.]